MVMWLRNLDFSPHIIGSPPEGFKLNRTRVDRTLVERFLQYNK